MGKMARTAFFLLMRLYWPKKAVLDGDWAPPPVLRKVVKP
jgi:hypothetical protein